MMLQHFDFDERKIVKCALVDFCIRSNNLDPAEITKKLGIQPSRAWAKGAEYLGKTLDEGTKKVVQCSRERPWGIWAIDSAEVDSNRVESHIEYLLGLLEPRRDEVRHYVVCREEYLTRFYVQWESLPGHGAFAISSDVLGRMTDVCQYVEFGYLCREPSELD